MDGPKDRPTSPSGPPRAPSSDGDAGLQTAVELRRFIGARATFSAVASLGLAWAVAVTSSLHFVPFGLPPDTPIPAVWQMTLTTLCLFGVPAAAGLWFAFLSLPLGLGREGASVNRLHRWDVALSAVSALLVWAYLVSWLVIGRGSSGTMSLMLWSLAPLGILVFLWAWVQRGGSMFSIGAVISALGGVLMWGHVSALLGRPTGWVGEPLAQPWGFLVEAGGFAAIFWVLALSFASVIRFLRAEQPVGDI